MDNVKQSIHMVGQSGLSELARKSGLKKGFSTDDLREAFGALNVRLSLLEEHFVLLQSSLEELQQTFSQEMALIKGAMDDAGDMLDAIVEQTGVVLPEPDEEEDEEETGDEEDDDENYHGDEEEYEGGNSSFEANEDHNLESAFEEQFENNEFAHDEYEPVDIDSSLEDGE